MQGLTNDGFIFGNLLAMEPKKRIFPVIVAARYKKFIKLILWRIIGSHYSQSARIDQVRAFLLRELYTRRDEKNASNRCITK